MQAASRLLATVLTLLVLGALPSMSGGSGTLVVLNKAEATASLIDLRSGDVVATLTAGKEHDGMAYSRLRVDGERE